MLTEKMNAIFPLYHNIFFQPFPVFSLNVHITTELNGILVIGHAIPCIICFQNLHRYLPMLQQFTDEDRNQIFCL